MKLEWKTHPIYNDYEVSKCSQVRSKPKIVNHNYGGTALKKGKILSKYINKRGYVDVGLTINKKTKTTRVHRLVAETWVPNPDNKPEVNHIDEDKSNNLPYNLEWCTRSENMLHMWAKFRERLAIDINTIEK